MGVYVWATHTHTGVWGKEEKKKDEKEEERKMGVYIDLEEEMTQEDVEYLELASLSPQKVIKLVVGIKSPSE